MQQVDFERESRNQPVTGLGDQDLPLEYERLAPDCIHWQIWIAKTGATVLQRCEVRVHRNYAQSIGAALAGKRLARGCRDEQPLADSTRIPASN